MDSTESKTTESMIDVATIKERIEEMPLPEHGWELVYDGPVRKDHPECTFMIYKKNVENDILAHTIIEGNYKGVKALNYFKMMTDPDIMAKGETPFRQLKVIEQPSEHTDVIYIEAELPPPMLTCDLLLKRTYFSVKDYPDFAKELGLFDLKHNYYIVYQTSIDMPEYPPGKNRIETKVSCWLIEENLEEDIMRFKAITSQKIHGITSPALVNKLGPQNAAIIFGRMLGNYFKNYEKGNVEKQKS